MDDLLGLSFQEVSGGRVHLVHSLQEWSSHWPPSQDPGPQPCEGTAPTIERTGLWDHTEVISSPDLASY